MNRRDALKTISVFSLAPLTISFNEGIKKEEEKTKNIFFGRNVKRMFNDTDFKPWLQYCDNFQITTAWDSNYKFTTGGLAPIQDQLPETTLRLNYPNYSLDFKSCETTQYIHYNKELPPISGIDIHYYDEYVIRMNNATLVSLIYMKGCKLS